MKDIRIFIASSRELVRERNALAFLVLSKEEEFAARGLRVRLAKWEYVDPKMTEARTEDRYLDEMYDCDAALVLFRNIAGMYTREELDKALARERSGTSRLKAHRILFAEDGAPDSDAAKLRASLPEGSYGTWSGMEELRAEFLSLVDTVAQREDLVEAPSDKYVRKITAFLASDEELADERDAFADTVLNVNDLLEQARRGIRLSVRFYDPARAEGVVESSEMGLVLYGANYRMFGRDEIERTYERVKDESQNPKRFYVFFHDLDEEREKTLDTAFRTFRDEFVSKLGHFVCQFGDANALRLSFLLSLERYAGESVELYSTVSAPTAPIFAGREDEMRRLCELLEPVPGKFPAGRLPVITGAGGTGKSELVRQFASQLRVQYPGGVFQVDMERRRTWDEAFLGILDGSPNNGVKVADYLELESGKDKDGESGKEPPSGVEVRDALLRKSRTAGPMLLVLDNVEGCEELLGEDGAFAKAFPSGFSERVRVNVVATARTCDVLLRENDWALVFPLGDLSLEAALELLFADKKAEGEEEKKAAERVAELLGRRALFLRRVPAILKGMNKKARIACRTYASLAKELEKDALGTITRTGTVDPSYWPGRLWEIVQGNLAEWGLGEACVRLVKIASFFSPDGFPKHILRHLWDELVYPGLEDWGEPGEVFDQVFDLSRQYNLFQSDDPVRIHRLDRAAILADLGDEKTALEETVGKALAGCLAASPDLWLSLAEFPDIVRQAPATIANGRFYAKLLSKNPELETFCSWDDLGGEDWSILLRERPKYANRSPWGLLTGWDWVDLLVAQPQFADKCHWEKLDGTGWAWLLMEQPQFADQCPWEKFEVRDWSLLLRRQPRFADRCPWENLDRNQWVGLLRSQPQFADRCPWEKLVVGDWAYLIAKQPQFADKCPWERLGEANWASLLAGQPQFADRCPWEKLSGRDWAKLLAAQPQFADRCPWEKLSGYDWAELLAAQPQFADKCPWEKLDGYDWAELLAAQPQFADKCPWEKLDGDAWAGRSNRGGRGICPGLLGKQPQFVDKCPWERLDGANWAAVLQMQPQFAAKCPWEKLDGDDWRSLLSEQPQFADKCPRNKLDLTGEDWVALLRRHPRLASLCQWDKLNGENWADLLSALPQFSDKCQWERLELDFYDWRELLEKQPQFVEKLDFHDWPLFAVEVPGLEKWIPWEKLSDEHWEQLLEEYPQFADRRADGV